MAYPIAVDQNESQRAFNVADMDIRDNSKFILQGADPSFRRILGPDVQHFQKMVRRGRYLWVRYVNSRNIPGDLFLDPTDPPWASGEVEQRYGRITGVFDMRAFLKAHDLLVEALDHPKRDLERDHAPDPAKSRAARQSARDPETKRKRADGQRKHEQSTAARNFHRKLGRFNSRMQGVRSEGSYRACVLALNEFYAAQPPRALLAEANRIRAAMTDGTHPVATFKSALIQLERLTEGKTNEVRLHRFDEADAHIASKRAETIALENNLGRLGKEADKAAKAFYAVSGMGYGPSHGYARYVGRTSPNTVTFYCKLDSVFGKLPELADPDVLAVIVGEENEYALSRLKEITGTRWFQVGRSGGHLLTDLDYAPTVSDDSTAGWDSEPGAEDSAPSERIANEITYLKEASGVNDDPEDAGAWVAYVDDLDAVKAGLGEWIAWVNQRVEKLNKVAAYIKTYMDGLPELLLQSIEANGYELADPAEWKKHFKSANPNPGMDEG